MTRALLACCHELAGIDSIFIPLPSVIHVGLHRAAAGGHSDTESGLDTVRLLGCQRQTDSLYQSVVTIQWFNWFPSAWDIKGKKVLLLSVQVIYPLF